MISILMTFLFSPPACQFFCVYCPYCGSFALAIPKKRTCSLIDNNISFFIRSKDYVSEIKRSGDFKKQKLSKTYIIDKSLRLLPKQTQSNNTNFWG